MQKLSRITTPDSIFYEPKRSDTPAAFRGKISSWHSATSHSTSRWRDPVRISQINVIALRKKPLRLANLRRISRLAMSSFPFWAVVEDEAKCSTHLHLVRRLQTDPRLGYPPPSCSDLRTGSVRMLRPTEDREKDESPSLINRVWSIIEIFLLFEPMLLYIDGVQFGNMDL